MAALTRTPPAIRQSTSRLARPDRWTMAGLAVCAGQMALGNQAPIEADAISVGMALLAVLCAAKTLRSCAPPGSIERWRWLAAFAGWLFWTAQWCANAVELPLQGNQMASNLFAGGQRLALVVALIPLSPADDVPSLRILDAALGFVFATLLTLLAWPELVHGAPTTPDRHFLYLGYLAMPVLAALSMSAQRRPALRALSRALFWTLLVYGLTGAMMRELVMANRLSVDSPLFVVGDLAFVAYLALLPGRQLADAGDVPDVAADDDTRGQWVVARLVPLVVTLLVLVLAFTIERRPMSVVIGIAGLLIYALRVAVVEEHFLHLQRAMAGRDRERLREMIDLMHEIRSPLGAIALNASLMSRSAGIGEDEREICQSMQAGCLAIGQLLDDVLTLERLEANLVGSAMEDCDLAGVVGHASALLASRAESYGVALQVPSAPFPARVDGTAVERIFTNLVTNALRFTPRGGTVRVTFAHDDDAAVTIAVADTGVGMTAETISRLFRRFDVVGKPEHGGGGSGIGLSISLALARTMGGTIDVRSTPGRGTTMTVVIPQQRTRMEQYTLVSPR